MSEVSIRVPASVYQHLTSAAAARDLSLRDYLIHLAAQDPAGDLPPGPSQVDVRDALHDWNGYQPSPAEQHLLDAELDRRLGRAQR